MANVKNIFPCLVFQVLPGAFRKTGHTFVRAQWFVWETASAHRCVRLVPGSFPNERERAFGGLEEESWLWLRLSR